LARAACQGAAPSQLADVAGGQAGSKSPAQEETHMLMTLVIILLVLWLLGLVTSYTLGGLLHVLLVIAIILLLVRVIQGRSI
jgi:hypothetical protein